MKFICSYENTWNGNENTCPHKDLYMKVHSSFIYSHQTLDTIQMLHPLVNGKGPVRPHDGTTLQ